MKPKKRLAELLSALIAIGLAVSPAAFAGPALPSVSGPVATFTGNQSNGIASGVDFFCPPIYKLNVNSLTQDITPVDGTAGIRISRVCGNGAAGSGTYMWNGDNGSPGGSDATPPVVNFDGGSYEIITSGASACGIFANNRGGNGGRGQNVVGWLGVAFGGNGGGGGAGGPVTVTSDGSIRTDGEDAFGIFAESRGGIGGDGGWAGTLAYGDGGDGGRGGTGGAVTILSDSSIRTIGKSADGIVGQSLGGAGGDGGWGGATVGSGGGALGSGPGGAVVVTSAGDIETYGTDADGIFAQSVGGFGGGGGTGGGAVAWGSSGNSVGNGGAVTVVNTGAITAKGAGAHSIFAQSVGGGGGNGGSSRGPVLFRRRGLRRRPWRQRHGR